eukprot:TRINITY_DN29700_c0_g1_i1.p1 TRINITY_DN29700_c0_g1~~TRINITY_DN29700_c0_g1_i1.p1  ORF type:complete len:868 (+),score=181.75 TRINITY_DN29700_c0_g1_i1:35-2638(+)
MSRCAFVTFHAYFVTTLLGALFVDASASPLTIDASAAGGQTFHGLGGISGGGATSRLLVDYPEEQRNQILDYLFKPNYGASLQILKVEIGGDSQSTDGTESSHMHSEDDLDYNRGYEWWLLTEAKKRNPEIKTYGLPWAYPGWVGGKDHAGNPFKHPELTSKYILKWLEGARDVYHVDIDYIGIWNERAADADYAKTLRKTLDDAGFGKTMLVAKDGGTDICHEMLNDTDYVKAIGVVGLHYPSDYGGSAGYEACHSLGYGVPGGRPLWASEESSSYDDLNGAACWARIVTSHWVLQGMTSSIMWNLVGSYFHGTNWYASSMLTAVEPWSGNYNALEVVWATAHITQFTKVGWTLLPVGNGSGQLKNGGFYATYADPESNDWTLTVVKISEDHAPCTRPALPHFSVSAEQVTFKLASCMANGPTELAVWYSNFEDYNDDGTAKTIFQRMPNIKVESGSFSLYIPVGSFFTVSTILEGPTKGEPPTAIPESSPSVPLPYSDDFENYTESQEGKWWSDQIGAFEVHKSDGGSKVMRQMVPQLPIGWSDHGSNGPLTVLGMREWRDITVEADARLPEEAPPKSTVCLGARLDQMWRQGLALCVDAHGNFTLSVGGPTLGGRPKGVLLSGKSAKAPKAGDFNRLSLTTVGATASASLNGEALFSDESVRDLDSGFAGLGGNDWFALEFDNVVIKQAGDDWKPPGASSDCPPVTAADAANAAEIRALPCAPNGLRSEGQTFALLADWGIRHLPSGLCARAAAATNGSALSLAPCDPNDALQQLKNDYTNVRNTAVPFFLKADPSGSLQLAGSVDGSVAVAAKGPRNSPQSWQSWSYFPNTGQLRNQYVADLRLGYPRCLTACGGDRYSRVFI